MEFVALSEVLVVLTSIIFAICLCLLTTLTIFWWILPNQKFQNLRRYGFDGPTPSFPLGNIKEMKRNKSLKSSFSSSCESMALGITHDIHPTISPYYSSWQKSYGKLIISFFCVFLRYFAVFGWQICTFYYSWQILVLWIVDSFVEYIFCCHFQNTNLILQIMI